MNDHAHSPEEPDVDARAVTDDGSQEEPTSQAPEVDASVLERRSEIVRQAREATDGRPDLSELIDRVEALDGVDPARHVEELDAVHRALRDALAAAGRDDPGAS